MRDVLLLDHQWNFFPRSMFEVSEGKMSVMEMTLQCSLLDSFVIMQLNVHIRIYGFHFFEDQFLSKSTTNELNEMRIDRWLTVFVCNASAKYFIPIVPGWFDARINVVNVYRSSSRSSSNVRRWFTWFRFKPLDRYLIAGGLREFPWRLRVVNVWKDFLLKEYSMKAEIQATLFICNTLPRCSIPDWLIELRARFNVVNV